MNTTKNVKKSQKEVQEEIWKRFPYIQIISEYIGANSKVKFHCDKCNYEWETTVRSVANSACGCPKCGVINKNLKRQKDHFLKRIDNSKWTVIDFKNNMDVSVQCKKCGHIRHTNANNVYRFGCKLCAANEHANKTRSNTEEFIQKAQRVHGDRYNYSKVNYINCKTPVIIICKEHGEFKQNVNHHLQGEGCPECRCNNIRSNTAEFIAKAIRIHGDQYDYKFVNYKHSMSHVKIICKKHGIFMQTPNSHLRGEGCPLCNESKGELFIAKFLDLLSIKYIRQFKIKSSQRRFILDFYIENGNNRFAIEFNGKQHYIPVKHFGGKLQFQKQQKRDLDLEECCIDQHIKLFTIKYDSDWEKELNRIVQEITAVHTSDCMDYNPAKTVNSEMGIPC